MNVFQEKGLTSSPSGSPFKLIYLGLFDKDEVRGGGTGLISSHLIGCSGLKAGLTPFLGSAVQEWEEKVGSKERRK